MLRHRHPVEFQSAPPGNRRGNLLRVILPDPVLCFNPPPRGTGGEMPSMPQRITWLACFNPPPRGTGGEITSPVRARPPLGCFNPPPRGTGGEIGRRSCSPRCSVWFQSAPPGEPEGKSVVNVFKEDD